MILVSRPGIVSIPLTTEPPVKSLVYSLQQLFGIGGNISVLEIRNLKLIE